MFAAILWREYRTQRLLLLIGLPAFLLWPKIILVTGWYGPQSRAIDAAAGSAITFAVLLGPLFALIVGAYVASRDVQPGVIDFLRSRPAPSVRVSLIKFVFGLFTVFAVINLSWILPSLLVVWKKSISYSPGSMFDERTILLLILQLFELLIVYSLGFAAGALMRSVGRALIVAPLLLAIVFGVPLVLAGLGILSSFSLAAFSGGQLQSDLATVVSMRLSIGCAVALAAVAIGHKAFARDWRVKTDARGLAWFVALSVAAMAVLSVARLGSTVPVLDRQLAGSVPFPREPSPEALNSIHNIKVHRLMHCANYVVAYGSRPADQQPEGASHLMIDMYVDFLKIAGDRIIIARSLPYSELVTMTSGTYLTGFEAVPGHDLLYCIEYSNGETPSDVGSSKLVLMDIRNPHEPKIRELAELGEERFSSIKFSGDRCYVTNEGFGRGSQSFRIDPFEVSDPFKPIRAGDTVEITNREVQRFGHNALLGPLNEHFSSVYTYYPKHQDWPKDVRLLKAPIDLEYDADLFQWLSHQMTLLPLERVTMDKRAIHVTIGRPPTELLTYRRIRQGVSKSLVSYELAGTVGSPAIDAFFSDRYMRAPVVTTLAGDYLFTLRGRAESRLIGETSYYQFYLYDHLTVYDVGDLGRPHRISRGRFPPIRSYSPPAFLGLPDGRALVATPYEYVLLGPEK
jgi:ABC-type transport system involved in multi-copper enzyme maturation permease subunit